MNKYKNTKTEVDGIFFDSKKEAKRYPMLRQAQKNKVISSLTLQPSFLLQEKFTKNGKVFREIRYIADFSYYIDDERVIEDTKGYMTEVFKIKRKLFEYKYPELTLKLT